MIKAILHGALDLRLEESDDADEPLGGDELLVRTLVTAMSTGTELANYDGRSTELPGAPNYPRAVGYCNVGVIEQTGTGVTGLAPGMRVFSLRPHLSTFRATENELLVQIPGAVSSEEASLCYLAQLGVAAMRSAGYKPGERVAVIGLGVIGLATVALARAMAADVTAIANHSSRAEAAQRLGANRSCISCAEAEKDSADIVILCANSWESYLCAVKVACYGGRISILGFPGRNLPPADFNLLDPSWFYAKQLHIIAAGGSTRSDIERAWVPFNLKRNLEFILRLMASGDVDLSAIISHRFRWHQIREAYELAALHEKSLLGAVFTWAD